jgi:hypothetical protein
MMKVPNHLYVLIFVPLLFPQSVPTQVVTQRVWWLTFREYSKCVSLYTIYISVAVNGPGMTSRHGVAREKRWERSQGHTEISPAKTYVYKCQLLYTCILTSLLDILSKYFCYNYLQYWLFSYPYGFCNPVRIHGKRLNYIIWNGKFNIWVWEQYAGLGKKGEFHMRIYWLSKILDNYTR